MRKTKNGNINQNINEERKKNEEKKKVNESNTYGFNLLLRLDLKNSNKNIVYQNLSIYYT